MKNDPVKTALEEALQTQSQSQLARAMRISPQMMCDVKAGRKAYGPRMLRYLGFRRVVSYERIKAN